MIREQKRQAHYHAYSNWYMQQTWGWSNWYRTEGHKVTPLFNRPNLISATTKAISKNQVVTAMLVADQSLNKLQQFIVHELLSPQGQFLLNEALNLKGKLNGEEALALEVENAKKIESAFKNNKEIGNWLILADICYWYGAFCLGFVFRQQAERLAHVIKIQVSCSPQKLEQAFRWALDLGDFERAEQSLSFLSKSINSQKHSQQQAYMALLQGQPEAIQLQMGIFKNQKLLIKGPAPQDLTISEDIQQTSDWCLTFNHQPEQNLVTHSNYQASLYNAHDWRRLKAMKLTEKVLDQLDACFVRRPIAELTNNLLRHKMYYCENINNIMIQKSFNAAPAAILEGLRQGAKQVSICGIDFFLSKDLHKAEYRAGYQKPTTNSYLNKIKPMIINHDLFSQRRWCQQIKSKGLLLTDLSATHALALSEQDYSFALSKNCKEDI